MCGGADAHSHIKYEMVNPPIGGGSRLKAQGARQNKYVKGIFSMCLAPFALYRLHFDNSHRKARYALKGVVLRNF
jgi:hypothetical protein